jgi:hypothetical protein
MTLLRAAALIAIPVGAVGSIGLFLRQAERAPLLIVIGFILWMVSPFALLAWAMAAAKRWSMSTRATIYSLALLITLASMAVYARAVDVAPRGSANAFRFVAVAPASWLLIAIVVPLATLASRRGA